MVTGGKKTCQRLDELTYGDVGLSPGAVESQLQGFVPVEEGKETLGPKGGDEISKPQPPVEAEDSVDVQSQTAAVVHQDAQLLPLGTNTTVTVDANEDEVPLNTTIIVPLTKTRLLSPAA